MNNDYCKLLVATTLFYCLCVSYTNADDWPMWRRDAARSARTTDKIPEETHLRWVRQFPQLKPAYREKRLQFDAGYEPIVYGETMYVASSFDDSVIALDIDNGQQRWQFFAEGPIRFAPVAWKDRLAFGSDDGCVYCLDATTGETKWKFRAVPSHRKVLAGGRMISLWPVRGGPVLHVGKIYFAAGVWPFEGVFIFCIDAESGKVIWRSDEASFVYGQHPHDAKAMGGVTPQGYLVVAGDDLIVPCGQAMPARFDLKTGKLKEFELPKPGRRPGGWFASAAVRRGEVTLDAEVNSDLHEDKVYQGPGSPGVRSTIVVSERTFRFEDGFTGVEGEIHTMLAANGNIFVVTLDGHIYCFGEQLAAVARHPRPARQKTVNATANATAAGQLDQILSKTNFRQGYALISGSTSADRSFDALIRGLLKQSDFHLVVTDSNDSRLDALRSNYRNDRERICVLSESSHELDLPRYFASLIIGAGHAPKTLDRLESLRPNGGLACLFVSDEEHRKVESTIDSLFGKEFSIERSNNLTVVRRGELEGAANYTGDWSSPDQLVRAPLGVLWFDDTLGHFKRSPQPWFVNGVMISYPKDWMAIHRVKRRPPYDLLPPVLSDIYTGRVISPDEAIVSELKLPKRDLKAPQPNQYRPPTQKDAWKPKQPVAGQRMNPLTGEKEPRSIPKSYGCDGGVDYGYIYTMRSGTPAFYDKRLESGVCSISGPRSGCTNSIIPAGGVLNVPFFYEGCTCSYPLPVGLALVNMPESHEQWSSWGPGKAENIQRVGINFGAPGDRMTKSGTLWLDYPSRGGPSPDISVRVEPSSVNYFYRHSLFVKGETNRPWVSGSGVQGAETIVVSMLKPATYSIRLFFLDPVIDGAEERIFDVGINDQSVIENLDITKRTGGPMRPLMQEVNGIESKGTLRIALSAKSGQTILCGLEIIKKGLPLN